MLLHDLPAAKDADEQYTDLARKRDDLESAMGRLREQIASCRRLTRILTTADSAETTTLAREMLMTLGASESKLQEPIGTTLTAPNGQDFLLVALTQSEIIRPFHIDLLIARVERSRMPKLVLLNSQVGVPPEERRPDLMEAQHTALFAQQMAPLGSMELYRSYRAAQEGRFDEGVWAYLTACWSARESFTITDVREVP